MNEKRMYYIYYGSQIFLNKKLPEFREDDDVHGFLELVRISDEAKNRGTRYDDYADILIVKNNNYHGIVEAAHDRLGALIEELTSYTADIYIHNPPRILMEYLNNQFIQGYIGLEIESETYMMQKDIR